MPHTIAVGVDGSAPSLVALCWALRVAARHRSTLIAVIAQPPALDRSAEHNPAVASRNHEIAEQLSETTRAITAAAQGAPVQVETQEGNPTEVLLAVALRVDLLVVSGHGYHGWRRHFTTSISGQLAVRTKAAICVVRDIAQPARGRILVGHQAETGIDPVRFAVAEAALAGSGVMIVTTWQYPRDTRATSAETAGILEEGAEASLAETVAAVRAEFPAVPIDTAVRLGHPVEVLAELADSADMVVIGSREHRGLLSGGLATLVVGSVAIGLLRRVQMPVVIVPQPG